MIGRILLKFGPVCNAAGLDFEPGTITVFVGPNNAGKSLVLRELEDYAKRGKRGDRLILEAIDPLIPEIDDVECRLHQIEVRHRGRPPKGILRVGRTPIADDGGDTRDVPMPAFLNRLDQMRSHGNASNSEWWAESLEWLFQYYLGLFIVALDGKTRLALTEERPFVDLQGPPANHLDALFRDDAARARVRRIVHEAFGRYFVIDPTKGGFLRVRMATRAPVDGAEEQSLDARARAYHSKAAPIEELSDGVKAFVGLLSAISSFAYRIMLVDEPEAFLHPPLAERLGREMATLASERDANVFASTHSPRFLMGCIESGRPTSIVRLTHHDASSTARILSSGQLRVLMRDPLLRSAGVLEALFFSAAIVCEGDKDRVFYAEINSRLQAVNRPHASDAVFLNAHNKQTVRRIVRPLRAMGIPAAAVVDFDIVKGNDLRDLLSDCFVPKGVARSLGQLRGEVERHFRESAVEMRDGGIELLSGEERESCRSLLDHLAEYGVFVVGGGEVESWLSALASGASKENWLPRVLDAMGSDPDDVAYARPEGGDVWTFVEQISLWISKIDRLGMPV